MFQTKPCGGECLVRQSSTNLGGGVITWLRPNFTAISLTNLWLTQFDMDILSRNPWCWYIYLHDWVILDKGKCWDSYSSTMVRIWDCIQSRSIYISKSSIYRWIFHYKPTYYLCQSMGSTQPLFSSERVKLPSSLAGSFAPQELKARAVPAGQSLRVSLFYHWNMTRTS